MNAKEREEYFEEFLENNHLYQLYIKHREVKRKNEGHTQTDRTVK